MQKHHARHTPAALGTQPVPTGPCVSPTYFEQERAHLFRRVWLNIGRVEDVPNAGDYFVKELAICKTSVLVVRSTDNRIRAFHNMCSHRGNKLAWDTQGTCRMLTCKFHGWSYGLNGQLSFVPDEGRFCDLDKNRLGLTPVTLDIWEGFLFVHIDPHPRETLDEFLGEFGRQLRGYPFHYMSTCYRYATQVNCNWKVALDAFQEIYHVPVLHRRTIGDTFSGPDNPFSHALTIKLYPRHRMMSLYGNPSYQPSPVESLAYRFGSVVTQGRIMEDRLPRGVNPTRSPQWAFDLNVIFPNFSVDVSAGTYVTHHFWPLTANRTLWEACLYCPPTTRAGQRFSQEVSRCVLRDTLLEDGSTLEATQSMLATGIRTHFNLNDEEVLVRHSHKVIDDYVSSS